MPSQGLVSESPPLPLFDLQALLHVVGMSPSSEPLALCGYQTTSPVLNHCCLDLTWICFSCALILPSPH
ncbi:hypothetical protein Mp_8g13130 [Marchantia polymorpha subsp. ruderalis]|uniref:Uncharacterized protein n=1 Tax=Marchantia polymorpha TaxID=3197 RepID=A0A2R6WJN5_MARPO|nr:hypothetical protein MARPO_0083s0008 [Marchantia polymorpha]BBN19728.1 hypothetical protein Mp_8g13130 [Marchantia polymorpha subsp. ruderalis]|eukprot:PTQ34039.1 hypothetical protein MARPO_0083s0008 [Marchantia polymorpha]